MRNQCNHKWLLETKKEVLERLYPNKVDSVKERAWGMGIFPVEITDEDYIAVMRGALKSLPSRNAEMIIAKYKDGLSLKEIGDKFDLSRERVRQLISEGFAKSTCEEFVPFLLFGVKNGKVYVNNAIERFMTAPLITYARFFPCDMRNCPSLKTFSYNDVKKNGISYEKEVKTLSEKINKVVGELQTRIERYTFARDNVE